MPDDLRERFARAIRKFAFGLYPENLFFNLRQKRSILTSARQARNLKLIETLVNFPRQDQI